MLHCYCCAVGLFGLLDDCLVGGLFWCIWFVVGVGLLLIYYLVSVDVVGFDCLVWFD